MFEGFSSVSFNKYTYFINTHSMTDLTQRQNQSEINTYNNEDFKAMYAIFNPNSEKQIKVFPEKKIITLDCLKELNEKISKKLKNHSFTAYSTKVIVYTTDKNLFSFDSFESFYKADWNIKQYLETISLEYDLFLNLPEYANPQRHTLKIKFGSQVSTSDKFQIMMNSDDEFEMDTSFATTVAKIDFINVIISREFLNIITEWFEAQANLEEKENSLYKILIKYDYRIRDIFEKILFLTVIFISYAIIRYFDLIENKPLLELSTVTLNNLILVAGIIIIFSSILASTLDRFLAKFWQPKMKDGVSIFSITNGDINRNCIQKKRQKINLIKFIFTSIVSLGIGVFSAVIVKKLGI